MQLTTVYMTFLSSIEQFEKLEKIYISVSEYRNLFVSYSLNIRW